MQTTNFNLNVWRGLGWFPCHDRRTPCNANDKTKSSCGSEGFVLRCAGTHLGVIEVDGDECDPEEIKMVKMAWSGVAVDMTEGGLSRW